MCVGLMGCHQGGRIKDSEGRGRAYIMQDGTSDLQHGTGVDGDSYLCNKGHYPKERFFAFEGPHIVSLYIVQYCINTVHFSPLQVKINNMKEL